MSNGHACCILGVCCPPGGAKQRTSLKTWLLEKIEADLKLPPSHTEAWIDTWLDELPWKALEG